MGARVIVGLTKFDHVSASMFDLHWLKIEYRILYKVCTIVFKARNGLAPSYIVDLLPLNIKRSVLPNACTIHMCC